MASPMRIHFGVDLVDQAASHIAFLKAINGNKELRNPEVLKRALYRYEKFWLPLAAEHPREYLSAPMDIEWVWHCHMLSPKSYEKDCYNIVRVTVNHTILRPDEFQRSRNKAHAYWSEKYSEPFYIDYGATYDTGTVSDFTSQISYDILSAVDRQRSFMYQVSLPHYLDRKFLESGLLRYKQFLLLKRQYPNEFLVPCYDIDLMWHTHQLNPIIYKNDTMRIVGQLLNHDDSVNERHEGSKLNTADKRTRELWKQVYKESFSKYGAMFRGNPPDGSFYTLTQKDEFSFCTKSCILSLDSLTLQIPSPDLNRSKHIELKASSAKVSKQEVAKWFKLKRPASSKSGNPTISWSKIGSFNFSTKNEHGILFSIHQKTGLLGTKTEIDSNFLDIIPIVESPVNASKPGGILKRKLTFKGNTTLDVQGHFQQPSIGDVFLFLEEGTYEDGVISDDVRMVLGPMGVRRTHSETENRCKIAVHMLKNHLRSTAIQVRTIHSTSMMTSVIQVLFQDKLCAVAHLIGADQLPLPEQVSHNMMTLNPKLGERAILIKNDNGDWGIVSGHWAGLRKGVPPSRGRAGIPGSPGTLRLKFYKMSTGELIQLDLGYGQKLYSIHIESTRVDLKNGIIQIDPQSNEVTENVSLVFAISLLHVLCVPRPKEWTEGQRVSVTKTRGARSIETIPSDSMSCVRAAGLLVVTPSNHYIANTYGRRLCMMCFGNHECHDIHSDMENERDNHFCADTDFGQTGYDVGGSGADAGCGGCGGCGGGFSGDGGIFGGGGDGGGGWDGGSGGDGGGDGGGASCGGCAGCRD